MLACTIRLALPKQTGQIFSLVSRFNYSSKQDVSSVLNSEDNHALGSKLSPPEGVRGEFFKEYATVLKRLMPGEPSHPPIRLSLLNKIFLNVASPSELKLMPELVERWRRRHLPMTAHPSRFFFRLAEKYELGDFGFQLLADRHRYGLLPRTYEFNRLLKTFASKAPHLSPDNVEDFEAQVELWGEKMIMTYGLMSLYDCKPDQETGDILVPSLVNSPLASIWALRLVKLVRELTEAGVVLKDDVLEPIITHRNNFNEIKAAKVSE